MEEEALDAVSQVESMIQKPKSVESFRAAFEQYKAQEALPDRLVNYWDKFDGLHEAIHEVVCGDHPDRFRQVIREYEPIFDELREANSDWMPSVELFLGEGFFDFPDADALPQGRKPKDLDYTDVNKFISSVAQGAPNSYVHWLKLNHFIYHITFFPRTFPGWDADWPLDIIKDLLEVEQGIPYRETVSGLVVPRSTKNPTFAETLQTDSLLINIKMTGAAIRWRDNLSASDDGYYFARESGNY